jgi:hypothetical protein
MDHPEINSLVLWDPEIKVSCVIYDYCEINFGVKQFFISKLIQYNNSNGQQFHQHQQSEESHLILIH